MEWWPAAKSFDRREGGNGSVTTSIIRYATYLLNLSSVPGFSVQTSTQNYLKSSWGRSHM